MGTLKNKRQRAAGAEDARATVQALHDVAKRLADNAYCLGSLAALGLRRDR